MPHSSIHFPQKQKTTKKGTAKKVPFTGLDRAVLVVSVLYPFSALPQIIAVFSGRTDGVSILSWMVFLVCTTLFFVYGVRRRVLPMMISNSIWIVMDSLVIAGILINGDITWI